MKNTHTNTHRHKKFYRPLSKSPEAIYKEANKKGSVGRKKKKTENKHGEIGDERKKRWKGKKRAIRKGIWRSKEVAEEMEDYGLETE